MTEIIIETDGKIMISRGTKEQNDIIRELFLSESDDSEALDRFLSVTDESEVIFGDSTYCG